jgi:hypothetical protein
MDRHDQQTSLKFMNFVVFCDSQKNAPPKRPNLGLQQFGKAIDPLV